VGNGGGIKGKTGCRNEAKCMKREETVTMVDESKKRK